MSMSEERLLRDFILSHRLITPEKLQAAIERRRDILKTGVSVSLEDVLVKQGFLSAHQVNMIHAAIGKGRTDLLEGYEILGKIGQGGMGAVYKARQIALDRLVAIKILLPSFSKEKDSVDRFLREARVLAKLSHPNIVNGIDAGHQKEIYYYVMEFVEGMNVAQILSETGKLPPGRALSIARQVASALDHAHRHGILHRDIKPGNIIIDSQGVAKLTDLGLAKLTNAQQDASITQTGLIVGSPAYMSPEQALDKGLDIRSDMYSLGVTLFEMLTGERPFEAATAMAILARKVQEEFPVDPLRRHHVSDAVISVIGKMCARAREDRHATPAELIADLDRAGTSSTQRFATPRSMSRVMRTTQRIAIPARRSTPLAAIVITVAGVVGMLVLVMSAPSKRASPPPAPRPVVQDPEESVPPPPIAMDPPRPADPKPPPAREPEIAPPTQTDPWEAALKYEQDFQEPDLLLKNFMLVRESLRDPARIAECDRRIDRYKQQLSEAVRRAQEDLEAAVKGFAAQEKFGLVRQQIAVAKKRFDSSEWQAVVRSLETSSEEKLERILADVRRRDTREGWKRLKTFEIPELSLEADLKLAALEKRETEHKALLEKEQPLLQAAWNRTVYFLRSRNYKDATAEIQALPLKNPDMIRDQKELLRAIELAGGVLRDAGDVKPVEEDTPTDWILTRYKSSKKTAEPTDQPLARFLFALFDGDAVAADAELKIAGPLRPEFEALLQKTREEHKVREARRKDANDIYRKAQVDLRNASTRDRGISFLKMLEEKYSDVLTRDQAANIKKILSAPAPAVPRKEIVIHADEIPTLNGAWKLVDSSNATSLRRVLSAQRPGRYNEFRSNNPDWFEVSFEALAEEYTLWLHMASKNHNENSVYVQIDDSDYAVGGDRAWVVQYWRDQNTEQFGWTDRDEQQRRAEPVRVTFKTPGRKKIRVYLRESGASIDQLVLSTAKYRDARPDQDKLDRSR